MQGEHADSTPGAGGGQPAPVPDGVGGNDADPAPGDSPVSPPGGAASIAFIPLGVPRRHQDVVRRHAVLVPLMGPGGDEGKILDQVGRLILQRRARLLALADAGLEEISGGEGQERRLRYALNCKPSFVITKEQAASCNLSFCPFCWARRVWEAWHQIDRAFFATTASGGPSPQHLIYRSATGWVPAQVLGDGGIPCDGLAYHVAARTRARNRRDAQLSLRGPGVVGGFEMLHVNPGVDDGWDFNVRQVLMASPGAPDPPPVPAGDYRCDRSPGPRRLEVRNAVALAARYPTFLMRGDPAVAVRYLDARRGRHISAMTGRFRNKASGPPGDGAGDQA